MQKEFVKHSIIFFLLLIYVNRGIFIVPYEAENNGNKEINSIVELIVETVTGRSNDIDEDGDSQSDCNFVKIVSYNFYQEFAQYLDMLDLYSKNIEFIFSREEDIPMKKYYGRIDHPPDMT